MRKIRTPPPFRLVVRGGEEYVEKPPTRLKIIHCDEIKVRKDYGGARVPPPSRGRVAGQLLHDEKMDQSLTRARDTISLTLLANRKAVTRDGWFWTGTFADDVDSYDDAVAAWSRFLRLLRKRWPDVSFLTVPEIQEQRAAKYGVRVWHFHAVIWGVKPNHPREFGAMWCAVNGDVHNRDQAERVRFPDQLSSYVRKYVTKTTMQDVPVGRKCYFSGGRLLVRPECEVYAEGERIPPIPPGAVVSLDHKKIHPDFSTEMRVRQYYV